MSNEMSEALNKQINNELYSAYIYLAMSAYFQSNNLSGFAKWLKRHAYEETTHAMKIYDYVLSRNWQINLIAISAPDINWNSPVQIFSAAYQHEKEVSQMINNLVTLAEHIDDKATSIFLQWFVIEQVEEEAVFFEILEKLKLIDGNRAAIFFLDADLEKKSILNNS